MSNTLYPVFMKLDQLQTLIVGGGNVAFEKISNILSNSPQANIKLIGKKVDKRIMELTADYPTVQITERPFQYTDLNKVDFVIIAIDNKDQSKSIYTAARKIGRIVNVADTPELCDVYLSSIVTKGDLKIAISTNGKSPTIGKRLKAYFNDIIPEDINLVLDKLFLIRNNIKGDFHKKVNVLNKLTESLSKPANNN